MDLLKEISENKFLLVLLEEHSYEAKLAEIVKEIEKSHSKICYVCLSKPYSDITAGLRSRGMSAGNFFFIDVLSSHYAKPKPVDNCIFIDEPNKLAAIGAAISRAIGEKNCSAVIFDTISSLLVYEQTHDIVRFTHELTAEEKHQNVNKIYVILKENGALDEYSKNLVKDVGMFADKTIDINHNQNGHKTRDNKDSY